MSKLKTRLIDERMLLLLAYCLSILNVFSINILNAVLSTNQNEFILNWLPIMRIISSISAVLTVFALILFLLRKAPNYKWIGYAILFMTVIGLTFVSMNDVFSNASPFYIALNLIHMVLNVTIAYLIITYRFCNKKAFNVVIALKFISASLRMGLPIIALFFNSRISQSITILLMNTDMILKLAVIVVLTLSLLNKPNEVFIKEHQ